MRWEGLVILQNAKGCDNAHNVDIGSEIGELQERTVITLNARSPMELTTSGAAGGIGNVSGSSARVALTVPETMTGVPVRRATSSFTQPLPCARAKGEACPS